jgi:hypothetical protein
MEQNRGAMADALANAEVAKARKAAAAANASEEAIMKIRAAGSPFGGPNKAGVFQATAKLDPSQVTDLRNAAKTTDIEALRGAIGTKLAAAEIAARDTKSAVSSGTSNISRATSSGDSRIVGAIIGNRPITNVTVNVSATSVQQKTTVVTRYGPTGGTRNTLPGYNTNHGH